MDTGRKTKGMQFSLSVNISTPNMPFETLLIQNMTNSCNADKSSIRTIVANVNKQPTEKIIHFRSSPISFGRPYNHLGFSLNNKAKLGDQIATARDKGWTSFYGLFDISISSVGVIRLRTIKCYHTRRNSASEYIIAWHM